MGAVRWILVVGGVAAILGALVWTSMTHRRRIDDLRAQLHDANPRVRATAGVSIIEDGSRRAAKELQIYLADEADARARLAVALAVVGRVTQGAHGDFEQWAAAELASVSAASMPAVPPAVSPVAVPSVAVPSAAMSPVEAVRPEHVVAYAMADSAPPADRAIHWKLEPDG